MTPRRVALHRLPRTLRRTAFWCYASAIFVLTHWPRLEVRVPGVERPDLIAHFAVFGLWYLLLFSAAYFGRLGTWRSLVLAWAVAAAYACVDEGLQLIPFIGRHAAWDDLAANLGGVTLGLISAGAWSRFFARPRRSGGEQSAS